MMKTILLNGIFAAFMGINVGYCMGNEPDSDVKPLFEMSFNTGKVWNVDELYKSPDFEVVSEKNGVRGIIYKSIDYKGKAKDVFAYYSTPGLLKGKPETDKNLPAVVCVHGGGGKAFEEWVKIWARRGYAAISMDCRGYGENRVPLENGFKEGEAQKTPFFVANKDITDDWFYQAIPDVLKAHSLILSFKEIDKQRTAVTGISWGGIITTLVAGLDTRFKVAVPVYGCGYLYETGSMAPQIKRQKEPAISRWHNDYDPSLYVVNSKIPMLFVNGTNDGHFFMNQWQKTTELVRDVYRSIHLEMKHGHAPGWKPEEIYKFIGDKLGVTKAVLPEFNDISVKDKKIVCKVNNVADGDEIFLLYSTSSDINNKAKWLRKNLNLSGNKLNFTLPEGTRMWLISVSQADKSNFSSKVYFR